MKVQNMLITSPTCKGCPAMKDTLKRLDIKYADLSIETTLGKHFSRVFGVQGVPYFVQLFRGKPVAHVFGNCPLEYTRDHIIEGGVAWTEE